VLTAAEELGYSANSLARSLISGRSFTVGVLAHRLDAVFTARQCAGIAEILDQRGYQMLVVAHGSNPDRTLEALSDMRARRMDGILSIATSANILPTIAEQVPRLGVPFVFAYHEPKDRENADCAIVDQVQGGFIATEYLLQKGYRRIAYVAGPLTRLVTTQRLEGYVRAHQAFGVAVDESLIVQAGEFFAENGRLAGEAILALKEQPDAIFAASDGLAAGILRTMRRAGVHLPEKMPVVGFDNSDAAALVDPPLTSVDMPMEELGRVAAARLIDHIESAERWMPQTFKLPCRLVVRESA
jgi:DNA-binding LacI/PurR family transcriptional regulator